MEMERQTGIVRVALAGFGGVGKEIATRLLRGDLPGAALTAVTARDLGKARANVRALNSDVPVVSLAELMDHADIVCECATAESFPDIARATMKAGKTLITVSVAGLPNCPDLVDLAVAHGGRIRVASGGLPGLDIIRGVREGTIHFIKLTTTFRPESLAHEPFVIGKGFDFTVHPKAPVKVFEGTAREAAAAFPRHFNVAITLSLGGVGFDKTQIEVWVDSSVAGAIQHIEVRADDADLTLESRNRPSANPRTSRIIAPSIMATLRTYVDPIQVGT
jgi:aspartate dehydrogenase